MIRDGVLTPEPVWTSPTPPGEGGDALHFVALHPSFAQNQLVYVSYPKRGERGITLAVARGRLNGNKLTDVQEIFVADAWETGGNLAGRIFFTPDATLYVTVGDRDRICCTGTEDNSLRMKAQKLDNHVGKTLRLRDDGTVPPDNPFVGRAGAKPEIFTYGHRNGYGLAIHPETGAVVAGRDRSDGRRRSEHPAARPQLWLAAGVDGAQLHRDAGFRGAVGAARHGQSANFLGALHQPVQHHVLHRRQVSEVEEQPLRRLAHASSNWCASLSISPRRPRRREGLLVPLHERIRDVQQSPDGYIYVATERAIEGRRRRWDCAENRAGGSVATATRARCRVSWCCRRSYPDALRVCRAAPASSSTWACEPAVRGGGRP